MARRLPHPRWRDGRRRRAAAVAAVAADRRRGRTRRAVDANARRRRHLDAWQRAAASRVLVAVQHLLFHRHRHGLDLGPGRHLSVEVGFPQQQAATAWGLSGVLLVIGMLTVSWLDGLLGRRRAILLAYSLTLTGILMLWMLSRCPNVWLLTGFLFCSAARWDRAAPWLPRPRCRSFAASASARSWGRFRSTQASARPSDHGPAA
jgi:hypothetical protein